LLATVESVLSQLQEPEIQDLKLEVIVVDDTGIAEGSLSANGSSLAKGSYLAEDSHLPNGFSESNLNVEQVLKGFEESSDPVTVLRQPANGGLTSFLDANTQVVAVASWADVVTKEGFPLYEVKHSDSAIQQAFSLPVKEEAHLASPQHYTMMFRRSAYEQAGGYRSEFYYAQDVDLWLRIAEFGEIRVIEQLLTKAVFSATSISGSKNQSQQALSDLSWQATLARQQSQSEQPYLAEAELIRPKALAANNKINTVDKTARFKSLYFIAKCLQDKQHWGARQYFVKALQQKPFSLKALLGFARSFIRANRVKS